jgi:DNA-binding IclR family transcriptional regulator
MRSLLALGGSARLKDLEQCTGIHAGTVHRYLVSLIRCGLVRREQGGSRYAFGLLAYQIGLLVSHRNDVVSMVTPEIIEFCERVGETCGVGMWIETGPAIVRWFEANRPVSIRLRPGTPVTLSRSSTGQMFAAHLPRDKTEPLIREELGPAADDRSGLEKVYRGLDEVKSRGLSRAVDTHILGVSSLTAPVFGHDGTIAFVVSAIGNSSTFDASLEGSLARELTAFARRLSLWMGRA